MKVFYMQVIKRDGTIQDFNFEKIVKAVDAAYKAVNIIRTDHSIEIIKDILAIDMPDRMLTVEDIQDAVEGVLMKEAPYEVAKAYILYRSVHAIRRESETRKTFEGIINVEKNDITRDNANMNADTPAGMMMKFASETTKPFVDKYMFSDIVKKAIEENYIYPHDKDYYLTRSLTCLQHPLDKILENGFICGHGEARPAKRIETAAALAEVAMQAVQNEMHGGQSIPAFDFYMAPYVRKTYIEEIKKIEEFTKKDYSDLYHTGITDYIVTLYSDYVPEKEHVKQTAINNTVKRVHQAMESFIHNCNNIHSRGGRLDCLPL